MNYTEKHKLTKKIFRKKDEIHEENDDNWVHYANSHSRL